MCFCKRTVTFYTHSLVFPTDIYESQAKSYLELFSEESETLTAQIDADGMIEIDDMIISPDMFRVMFPSVENHPK